MSSEISYIVTAKGDILSVVVPYALWQRLEPEAQKLMSVEDQPKRKPEPLADFDTLMEYWSFRYPYSPAVTCPSCGTSTEDWRNDPSHPFWLHNASLGGLLVFHCDHCGATVRQKHFTDHVAVECS